MFDPSRVPSEEVWPNDIPITSDVVAMLQSRSQGGEDLGLTFWEVVAAAPDSFAAFARVVQAARPDLLQFEEPFLWPVIRRLRAAGLLDGIKIVHSSYNFETHAQREIRSAGLPLDGATLGDVLMLEREIAAGSDLVIAVSEDDADAFRTIGATRVCVAANGIESFPVAIRGDELQGYLPPDRHFALFISSAHPPNARGLIDLAVGAGRALQHGELLICGAVGELIRNAPGYFKAQRVLHAARYLGWVDDRLLRILYQRCRVIILPKTLGGGSNLKTAEALASGRPIVSTRRAFEGFERYISAPGVTVENEAGPFWEAVDAILAGGAAPARPQDSMQGLLWQECLHPMVEAATHLVGAPGGRPRD